MFDAPRPTYFFRASLAAHHYLSAFVLEELASHCRLFPAASLVNSPVSSATFSFQFPLLSFLQRTQHRIYFFFRRLASRFSRASSRCALLYCYTAWITSHPPKEEVYLIFTMQRKHTGDRIVIFNIILTF